MKKKSNENKQNKNKQNETVQTEKKVKFSEKLSIKFKRKWLVTKTKTFLIVAIFFAAYIALNLWASQAELPSFDTTENKLYTLTDTSKKVLESVEQDVVIYVYCHEETEPFIDLLKQYNKVNEKITY